MIFYFSATGNSRWVAEGIASLTHDVAYDINELKHHHTLPQETTTAEVVGVVFPIHSWCAPSLVTEFLTKLPIAHRAYRYAICTCGDDAGKAMQLLSRRFPLQSAWSVQMPNTYVPMFKLDDDALCQQKIEQATAELFRIAEAIKEHRPEWRVNEGAAAWAKSHLVNPLFVWGISAKGFHTNDACTGCGTCAKSCPVENIQLKNGRPVWADSCIHCMACYHACPVNAIHYKRTTQEKGQYRLQKYLK